MTGTLINTGQDTNSVMSDSSWLHTFLGRVAKPTYFRSNSTREIHQDFAKARLEDELERVDNEIRRLENRRKDIIIMGIVESTVKNRHLQALRRLKITLPISLSCTPSTQYFHKEEGANELDSKKLMLQNENQLHACRKFRRKIRAGIVVRRRLLSAVYRMPPKIWAQIFVYCLPEDDEYVEPNQTSAPLLLCRVCYAWRSAANRAPALWRSLVVPLGGKTTRKAFLKTWIDRAGTLPLSLHILWGRPQSLHFYDIVFDYLHSLAHRWLSVKLSSVKGLGMVWQTHGFPTRAHKLLSYPMPILQTLELETALSLGLTSLERNAPKLRALWLMNSALNPMHLMAGTSAAASLSGWHQLASFRSRHPLDKQHAVRIFRLCPNLVECEMALVSCPAVEPVTRRGAALVKMRVLEALTINETSASILDAFLRVLVLPALKELTLSAFGGGGGNAPWSATEIVLLISRSTEKTMEGAKLSTLRMTGLNCDEKAIGNLVFGIPTLFWFDMRCKEKEMLGHYWVMTLRATRCRRQKGSISAQVCPQGNRN